MTSNAKWYVVFEGLRPGIYTTWYDPGGAHEQVDGVSKARHRMFTSEAAARKAWRDYRGRSAGSEDRVVIEQGGKEVQFPLAGLLLHVLRTNGFLP